MMKTIKSIFFFQSRRRHRRWRGDWSSAVCSSDLVLKIRGAILGKRIMGGWRRRGEEFFGIVEGVEHVLEIRGEDVADERSEERRGGEEWWGRSWGDE